MNKIITIAQNEIGYLEKASNSQLSSKTANAGSGNYTKYGAWYNGGTLQGQPWCDIFLSWCAAQAGESSAVGCYAYCPNHKTFFQNKGRYHGRSGYTPTAGDVIFFTTNGTTACHVGLVECVSGGRVTTIEGNTSGASALVANGGGVCRKSYLLTSTYILGYGNPAYTGSDTESTQESTQSTAKKTAAEAAGGYDKSLAGAYTVTPAVGLNLREGAGTGKALMVTLPRGTRVQCYGYYTPVSGVKWLYVVATLGGVQYTGFCCRTYLKAT